MRIRTTAAALAIIGLLALPAGALAGGWATVGLSSTPDGVGPGQSWNVALEILQHGRTPLNGVHPTVTIVAGDTTRTFQTRPAGRPGTYRAAVMFPGAGTWRYVVDDGFTARHSYPAVRIGARAADDVGGGGLAVGRLLLAGLAGLAAAALVLIRTRTRTRGRASPAALGG
ncbi:MAG: hypothetical protein QOH83_653 [Solirubrobacteraceae bacterium]|jgi:hypothetical protein|nr:hypothetical protein [Solirubrobacteraceae bacterium]